MRNEEVIPRSVEEGASPIRHCPRDGQPLSVEIAAGIPIDVCRECDHVWLDPGEIDRVAPGFSTEELLAPPQSYAFPRAALACPACRKGNLLYHYYGKRKPRVEVGICDRCAGLWLDFGLMREYGRQHQHQHQHPEPAASPDDLSAPTVLEPAVHRPAAPDSRYREGVSFPRHPREWFVAITGMPLEVSHPCTIVPYATLGLVAACVAVFVAQLFQPGFLIERFGLVPALVGEGEYHRLFTSIFLHANVFHLAGNLFFLYTFGDNLEEKYGAPLYLFLYFGCGLSAAALSVVAGPAGGEDIPRVGASGAISGILGAYLVAFPGTRIIMGIPFLRFFPVVLRWRVWAFVLVWVVLNAAGFYEQSHGGPLAVDYVAHLGGFATGIVFGGLLVVLSTAGLEAEA